LRSTLTFREDDEFAESVLTWIGYRPSKPLVGMYCVTATGKRSAMRTLNFTITTG
jgi:hypothetical protein